METTELEDKATSHRGLWWKVAAMSTIASIVGALLARWGPFSEALSIGSLDGWVAGASSILAVCTALWTVSEARDDRVIERIDERAALQRAEAMSVVGDFLVTGKHLQPAIYNFGQGPIRDVEVKAWPIGPSGDELRGGAAYPLEFRASQVAPGCSVAMTATSHVRVEDASLIDSLLEYSFMDIFGTCWRRATDGSLTSE